MAAAKQNIRARIRARRAAHPRPDLDEAIAAHAACIAHGASQVAAYYPTAGEPGGCALLPALSRQCRPLIPRTLPGHAMDLGWADGPLIPAHFGAQEPAAGGHSFSTCDLIFVPALACTPQGLRLGQGGGFYDRALGGDSNVPTIALLYDEEVLDELPIEDHDMRVCGIITPSGLIWCGPQLEMEMHQPCRPEA
ncbi:5-formyltetrahydrofolate cyclo-ligase [Corynebacterium sp. 13CS0277]|uniref:5-formyltetrahydrofolate cyclo-ligase n=1 Tax=Corynebacterium sp. 13CS0277 TaxID=2071994 RepID=UPI001304B9E2|nr:5-formyltetrahydrofolate cyclo-ligase [Corynebacterium sp. 13CS0277]